MCGRIWVNWLRREYSSYKCPQSSPLLWKQGEVVPQKIPKKGVWILCWVIGCIMLWVNWPVVQNSPYKSLRFSILGQLVTSHWSGNIKNTKTSSGLFMTGIYIIKVFSVKGAIPIQSWLSHCLQINLYSYLQGLVMVS